LGWFKRGKVLENKEEEKKMNQGGFFLKKSRRSWKYLR
jgi:hypothetical protein